MNSTLLYLAGFFTWIVFAYNELVRNLRRRVAAKKIVSVRSVDENGATVHFDNWTTMGLLLGYRCPDQVHIYENARRIVVVSVYDDASDCVVSYVCAKKSGRAHCLISAQDILFMRDKTRLIFPIRIIILSDKHGMCTDISPFANNIVTPEGIPLEDFCRVMAVLPGGPRVNATSLTIINPLTGTEDVVETGADFVTL